MTATQIAGNRQSLYGAVQWDSKKAGQKQTALDCLVSPALGFDVSTLGSECVQSVHQFPEIPLLSKRSFCSQVWSIETCYEKHLLLRIRLLYD